MLFAGIGALLDRQKRVPVTLAPAVRELLALLRLLVVAEPGKKLGFFNIRRMFVFL